MSIIRAVARLPYFTSIPEDVVTNTFHFATVATPTTDQITAMLTGVSQFYTDVAPTDTVGEWMAGVLSRATGACQVELYNLDDPEPRLPIGSTTFTLPAAVGSVTVPLETSLCLSYRAAYTSGEPNARRRGRAYIGPLSSSAITSGSGSLFPSPNTSCMSTFLQSAADHLYAVPATESVNWVVYSASDNVARVVVQAWVDNAFDTQRRRGNSPSARTTISIP